MTFTRLLSLGLGAVLALFVTSAVLVGIKTQSIADSISVISLQHNPASRANAELEVLLLKIRQDFHEFEQRGRIYPRDFTQTLLTFRVRVGALRMTEARAPFS